MPSEERFAVIRRLLERAGWKLVRINGSHHIFEKPGKGIFSVPVHGGWVRPFYAREARRRAAAD